MTIIITVTAKAYPAFRFYSQGSVSCSTKTNLIITTLATTSHSVGFTQDQHLFTVVPTSVYQILLLLQFLNNYYYYY